MNEESMDNLSEHEVLENLYDDFKDKLNEYHQIIDKNEITIEELKQKIKDLEIIDDDRQMFSPRNILDSNKDKIEDLNREVELYLKENKEIREKIDYYSKRIEALESVVPLSSKESPDQVKEAVNELNEDSINKNLRDNIEQPDDPSASDNAQIDHSSDDKISHNAYSDEFEDDNSDIELSEFDLENILNKINLAKKFIRLDPLRCELELNSVADDLKKYLHN